MTAPFSGGGRSADWTVDQDGYPLDREALRRRVLVREIDAEMATRSRDQAIAWPR